MQTTFGIIKPDATKRNIIGEVLSVIEKAGLQVIAMRYARLTRAEAEGFYAEHKERPFFGELVDFMVSGPVVLLALRGENAVTRYRTVMGATNPAEADEGTIRKLFAASIGENTVHGSDSETSAERELNYFFAQSELLQAAQAAGAGRNAA